MSLVQLGAFSPVHVPIAVGDTTSPVGVLSTVPPTRPLPLPKKQYEGYHESKALNQKAMNSSQAVFCLYPIMHWTESYMRFSGLFLKVIQRFSVEGSHR